MVVVDFSGGFAVIGAEDPPGVLKKASLLGDGRGEEEGVERRAVEPFPGVGPGGDREQRRPAGLRLEAGQRGGPLPGAHASAQRHPVTAGGGVWIKRTARADSVCVPFSIARQRRSTRPGGVGWVGCPARSCVHVA
jgi:hypothetical protein